MYNNNSEIVVYCTDPGRKCFYRPYDEGDYVIPLVDANPSFSSSSIRYISCYIMLYYIHVICYILSLVQV